MMIFKKAIPRRAFLRGLGATLALPLLDGMVPAFAAGADTAAKPATRLGVVYVPNGIIMDKWTPAHEGPAIELTPVLEPLGKFRDQMLLLSGLNQKPGRRTAVDAGGDHARAGGTFLTGVHPKQTEGSGSPQAGISVDQIAAKEFGQHTQLASLELTLDSAELVGACEQGWSCAYINTLSWRTPTTPVTMENNPRAVFERLFGDSNSTNWAERLSRLEETRSILDSVNTDLTRFLRDAGASDRRKLMEYLDAIRDVERRIQVAEDQGSRELPSLRAPAGIPDTFDEYAKLMFDLQVLAYQCDLTRVITFMMGRESSYRPYREIGILDGHHALSHHRGDPAKIAKVFKINVYHAKMFAYYLDRLRSTPDGDGSLLDHMMILYGSGLGDGNTHSFDDLPILLVGGNAVRNKGNRHIRFPKEKETPITNLYLTMLDMLGVPTASLGDSTGKLEFLSL